MGILNFADGEQHTCVGHCNRTALAQHNIKIYDVRKTKHAHIHKQRQTDFQKRNTHCHNFNTFYLRRKKYGAVRDILVKKKSNIATASHSFIINFG